MPRFANVFAPQTEVGQGLNAAVHALFSGNPYQARADRDALAALRMAQIETEKAQQRKYDAEAADKAAITAARGDIGNSLLRSVPGVGENLPDVIEYLNTGQDPMVEAAGPPTPMGAYPEMRAPWFTPEVRRGVQTASMVAPLIQAGGGKADDLAKAVEILSNVGLRDSLLRGDVTPTQYFQANLKPVTDVQQGYMVNPAEPGSIGATPETAALAEALVRQRDAAAGLSGARAATEGVRQGLIREQTRTQSTVQDRNRAAAEKLRRQQDPKAAARKGLTVSQQKVLAGVIASIEDEQAPFDADTKARITSRATQLILDPESEFHQDPAGAAQQAIGELGEMEVEGKWNPFKANRLKPKGKPAAKPAAAAPAAPSGRPAGKTDQQLIDEANAAIKKGADRQKVMDRLKAWGVPVS